MFPVLPTKMYFLFVIVLAVSCVASLGAKRNFPEPSIIGGQSAKRGEFPYMVSLQFIGIHGCGGAIVTPRWVVTAAHCFNTPFFLVAVAGLLILREDHPDIQTIPAKNFIKHPDFNNANLNDIALVELKDKFVFNEAVQPIPLPKPNQHFNGMVTVTGWGRTSFIPSEVTVLQLLRMPLISVDDCRQRLQSIGKYPWNITEVHTCALPQNLGQSGCHQDSGSPLVQGNENGHILVGVVQGGDPDCGVGLNVVSPNVYTGVSNFINFILSYVDDTITL